MVRVRVPVRVRVRVRVMVRPLVRKRATTVNVMTQSHELNW